MGEEPVVEYTVKEVLSEIKGEIREIRGVFIQRLDGLEGRLAVIEHERSNRRVFRENWLALIALVAALMAGIGAMLAAFHG